jgi:hypothetical protein
MIMSAPTIAIPGSVQRDSERKSDTKREAEAGIQSEQDIANLAYALWQQRGCPVGSA